MGYQQLLECVPENTGLLQKLISHTVSIGGDVIEVCSPFQAGTTAGRLIEKRGDGGYMIIMQTMNADKRRVYIESKGLSKVIYSYQHNDVHCIQYNPKGIKGKRLFHISSSQYDLVLVQAA